MQLAKQYATFKAQEGANQQKQALSSNPNSNEAAVLKSNSRHQKPEAEAVKIELKDCRYYEFCGNQTSHLSGNCQPCFFEYRKPCVVCETWTTYSSNHCGSCFAKKLYKCYNCNERIGQPGKCKPCFEKAKSNCSMCSKITHRDCGMCKECEPLTCDTCQAPIELGKLCTPCYMAKDGKTLCVSCEKAYTKHSGGKCSNCYHLDEGHSLCFQCFEHFSETTDKVCNFCYKQKLFDCQSCSMKMGNPGFCYLCRQKHRQTKVTELSKNICQYFYEAKHKKIQCSKLAMKNSKYCPTCQATMNDYQM